jgi:putative lipoic acid-binding regulatory protein
VSGQSDDTGEKTGPELGDDEERARAIALLEMNHVFPTVYAVSVIARNVEEIAALIVEAAFLDVPDGRGEGGHETRASSGGKYLSHHLTVPCADAEGVLRLYARLRAIDGVMTIL